MAEVGPVLRGKGKMEGLTDPFQFADGLEDSRLDAGFPEDAFLVIADEAAVIAGQVVVFDAIMFELGHEHAVVPAGYDAEFMACSPPFADGFGITGRNDIVSEQGPVIIAGSNF